MRALLLAATLVATAPASAIDGWVDIHTASIHSDDLVEVDGTMYEINNTNPGIGITLDNTENVSLRFGTFENSYRNRSNYIAVDSHTSGPLVVGVSLGIVSGYALIPTDSNVRPMLVPHIGYQLKRVRAELSYLHGEYTQAVALTVGFRF